MIPLRRSAIPIYYGAYRLLFDRLVDVGNYVSQEIKFRKYSVKQYREFIIKKIEYTYQGFIEVGRLHLTHTYFMTNIYYRNKPKPFSPHKMILN
jgi:hypothetical protein